MDFIRAFERTGVRMFELESFYTFMESNFDYLLVVDGGEHITHVSDPLLRDCNLDGDSTVGKHLARVVTPSSLDTLQTAIAVARTGSRGMAVFTPAPNESTKIPLKPGRAAFHDGEVFLFFGNRLVNIRAQNESEKDARIKELACLYSVAEWIEESESVRDFFTQLPRFINTGMMFPEQAVVYSICQDVEYGQKPSAENHISTTIVVNNEVRGEIRIGYLDEDRHELLLEEQKMLTEIGRILSLALERKELKDKLKLKQQEEEDYNRHLKDLEQEIALRTKELEDQKKNLEFVNTYLDRVSKGWEESKTRLETMFKAIPDDVILLDKNRKIIMTNRENIQLGEHCYEAYFGRQRPCEDCRLARILRDKTPLMLMIKDDNRYLQVHALPVYNQDHEVDGIMEFYRDVTLEKTYERQLQQADKLASLGQLVSGIGHEINNPNQFIRGNIKIINQAIADMLPIVDDYHASHPDLRIARLDYDFFRRHIMTLVDDISHGSDRIKAIVAGLRNFVRTDEGLLLDSVDLNTLIEASARLVQNEVHKRADIQLELADDLPRFSGNAQKLEQVLVNLVVNARDAIPENARGLITIRTMRGNEDSVVVEVEDDGKGMDQEIVNQIFDPFFTTKRAKGGTGLGLTIVYKIIEEHGGNISVSSKVGVGTKFTITFPVHTGPAIAVKE